jgi:hypothetical protein
MSLSNIKWVCTDTNQYGRKLRDGVYEFKEDDVYPDGLVLKRQDVIDLADYTDEEINNHLSAYGWDIKQLIEENGEEGAKWLMAECIFEQEIF